MTVFRSLLGAPGQAQNENINRVSLSNLKFLRRLKKLQNSQEAAGKQSELAEKDWKRPAVGREKGLEPCTEGRSTSEGDLWLLAILKLLSGWRSEMLVRHVIHEVVCGTTCKNMLLK